MKNTLTHKKNSTHVVKIEDMTNLGSGVAHLDGAAVFVNGAVDGDECEIKIIKVASGYYAARIERIITPSQHRTIPDCPVSGRCGGCVYRHITYEHELELKRRYVVNAFKKAGISIDLDKVDTTGNVDAYRNKIQYPVGRDGKVGYYANHTHDIIECTDCRLQRREFDLPVAVCCEFVKKYTKPGIVRHLYLRCDSGKGSECGITVCLVIAADKLDKTDVLIKRLTEECSGSDGKPKVTGIMLNINKADTNVILGDKFITLYGEPYIIDRMWDVEYKIAPAAFYQVNHDAAELLYAKALEFAEPKAGDHLLDLYCGAGTIGLYFASRCPDIKVTGIEVVDDAVVNARENAERNGIKNAEFSTAELGTQDEGVKSADIAVLDPPRKGCAEPLIRKLAELDVPKIVYVSCSVDTLARDAARLGELGYRIERLAAVDLFPRTGHVETVCLLSKLNAKQHIEINLDMDELDLTDAEKKATYQEIKDYVLEHSGLKVSSLYIAQVKQQCGIIERENYNKPKSEDAKQPQCPPDKEKAIKEALQHFGMI